MVIWSTNIQNTMVFWIFTGKEVNRIWHLLFTKKPRSFRSRVLKAFMKKFTV